MKNIEQLAHWISISSMAGAMSLVCAGHTVWEPMLQSTSDWASLLYWGVSAAFVISTAVFAYVALAGARQRLGAVETRTGQPAVPEDVVSFRAQKESLAAV
jgi:hypothetical protein